ncbi:MAG: acetylxylan esterase [Tannerella sp.]|jgi:cephalosporin-C deacetylase-like acetyl esterase|nr:acetylxylan esterase [Tannerella sp.]
MKNYFHSVWLLLLLWGVATQAGAQPAQKQVTVVISPDRGDWRYGAKEEAVFGVQVFRDGNLLKNVTVDYETGPEGFPTVRKQDVVLKEGKITLKSSMKEPGFLRCRVVAKVDGREYEGLATVACDETQIRPATADPDDFDAFWTKALEEARREPPDSRLRLLPELCTSGADVYEVSFRNEKPGSRIYGILRKPRQPGRYPAILSVPGAGIRPYSGADYGDSIISLQIGIHGLPVTLPQEVYNSLGAGALSGYPSINRNNRDAHYYKRVYLGCVRAVDFLFELPEFDGYTVAVTGGSQGGALSIVTAALDPRIKYLAAFYPALCDYAGYLNRRAGGWPHYFRTETPGPNEVETLAYFDVVNFARRVRAKGMYSWGFNDVTCPPTSMYAAYNVIPGPRELKVFLTTGHWTFPEQNTFVTEWLLKQLRDSMIQ